MQSPTFYIEFAKDFLKEYNYPNIYAFKDDQVADIFSNVNRQFFLQWIFRTMNQKFEGIIDSFSLEELADLIYQYGFFNAKEKLEFVKGTLPATEQLKLYYKIFKFIKDCANSQPASDLSVDEVQRLLDLDVNLFPCYGEKKTLTEEMRQKKLEEYKAEIVGLEEILDQSTQYFGDLNLEITGDLKSHIAAFYTQIKDDIFKLKRLSDTVKEYNENTKNKKYSFTIDLDSDIERFRSKLTRIKEFMDHIDTLQANCTAVSGEQFNNSSDYERIANLIKDLSRTSSEDDKGH